MSLQTFLNDDELSPCYKVKDFHPTKYVPSVVLLRSQELYNTAAVWSDVEIKSCPNFPKVVHVSRHDSFYFR